nr:unnamed protein product [Digitaria exilis]
MGNCLERSSLGGGGGGGAATHYAKPNAVWVEEEVGRKEEEACKGEGEPPPATTEVKIRITRKQLEELLRRVEDGKHGEGEGGVPVRDVVSELLSVASTSSNFRHREEGHQWRPSLQSIPE